jgi:hypothetical protein
VTTAAEPYVKVKVPSRHVYFGRNEQPLTDVARWSGFTHHWQP